MSWLDQMGQALDANFYISLELTLSICMMGTVLLNKKPHRIMFYENFVLTKTNYLI